MSAKIRVGILFGGQSPEHEVSLQSARNVIAAIDKQKYEPVPIAIDKQGRWLLPNTPDYLLHPGDPKRIALNPDAEEVSLNLGTPRGPIGSLDLIFPVLHGAFGEDGTVQGLLELLHLPYVGADVLGSAVGMDKEVMKRLFTEAGLPNARAISLSRRRREPIDFDKAKAALGAPIFIKPANLGSSVGISKVRNAEEFEAALDLAFQYDNKVLLEEFIEGREIECAVLGNENPQASVLGEIKPTHDFYSYEAKYLDENGAVLEIPAQLPPQIAAEGQRLAVKAFETLCCSGMARVDFFLRGQNEWLVNEINTIPGFTNISMYPRLWGASGLGYADLIDRLIQLALDRFENKSRLKTAF